MLSQQYKSDLTGFLFIVGIGSAMHAYADPSLSVSGYLEGSYNYLASANRFTSEVYDRAFDLNENGLTLQQAAVTLGILPDKGLGGAVNIILGKDAFIIAPYGMDPDFGNHEIGWDITQLWLQCRFSENFYVAMGKFVTLAGYETINPTTDTNFSRSDLFTFAIPFTLTGFRLHYTINPHWQLCLGMIEGWDTVRPENGSPSLEWALYYTPTQKLFFSAVGYLGHEQVISRTHEGPVGTRSVIDLIASYKISDHTQLALNYDYGWQNDTLIVLENADEAIWQGIAAYWVQTLNSQWNFCLRGEIFQDRNGYRTGVAQTLREFTATLAYKPITSLTFRAETRWDHSNTDAFMNKITSQPRTYQRSCALDAIWSFS